jgi:hypothetical protein
MRKYVFSAFVAALVALGATSLVAQTVSVPTLGTMYATDLFRDISQGNPSAQSQYVPFSLLTRYVNSSSFGLPPALTSCGTGTPVVIGNDLSGTITMGGSATGCVVTFAVARNSAPNCLVTWHNTPLASQSYVVSATALTLTQTSTSGNAASYYCPLAAGF